MPSRNAPLFCLVLLTVSCGLASFAFACATPFAAFAGAILPVSAALPVVVAAWIVNQAIGFGGARLSRRAQHVSLLVRRR
jgi:hypothetical protein